MTSGWSEKIESGPSRRVVLWTSAGPPAIRSGRIGHKSTAPCCSKRRGGHRVRRTTMCDHPNNGQSTSRDVHHSDRGCRALSTSPGALSRRWRDLAGTAAASGAHGQLFAQSYLMSAAITAHATACGRNVEKTWDGRVEIIVSTVGAGVVMCGHQLGRDRGARTGVRLPRNRHKE